MKRRFINLPTIEEFEEALERTKDFRTVNEEALLMYIPHATAEQVSKEHFETGLILPSSYVKGVKHVDIDHRIQFDTKISVVLNSNISGLEKGDIVVYSWDTIAGFTDVDVAYVDRLENQKEKEKRLYHISPKFNIRMIIGNIKTFENKL